jgi:alkylated DNA repair protein alkB family protein 6
MIASGGAGKSVAAVPLGHLLLLPRSLLVLTGSLYESHLHGIAERAGDTIVSAGDVEGKARDDEETMEVDRMLPPVTVANASLLDNPKIQAALATPRGWTKDRGIRTSLTFRRAEKVLKGGAFALVGGKLRRG